MLCFFITLLDLVPAQIPFYEALYHLLIRTSTGSSHLLLLSVDTASGTLTELQCTRTKLFDSEGRPPGASMLLIKGDSTVSLVLSSGALTTQLPALGRVVGISSASDLSSFRYYTHDGRVFAQTTAHSFPKSADPLNEISLPVARRCLSISAAVDDDEDAVDERDQEDQREVNAGMGVTSGANVWELTKQPRYYGMVGSSAGVIDAVHYKLIATTDLEYKTAATNCTFFAFIPVTESADHAVEAAIIGRLEDSLRKPDLLDVQTSESVLWDLFVYIDILLKSKPPPANPAPPFYSVARQALRTNYILLADKEKEFRPVWNTIAKHLTLIAMDAAGNRALADANELAVQRVSELFRHPDDLLKLNVYRQKFGAEKASLEAQLKAAVQTQLDDAQRGMNLLAQSKEEYQVIRGNLQTIDSLCSTSQTMIQNYGKIKKLSRTHRNFTSTMEIVEQFQQLTNQIGRVKKLLDEDKSVSLGPADNLLFVHHTLFQLEQFRDETMEKSRSSSTDVVITLQQYFKRFEAVMDEFTDYLFYLSRNILPLVLNGQRATVVRLAKVIETEERMDEYVSSLNSIPDGSSSETARVMAKRKPKSYLSRFKEEVQESIAKRFQKMLADVDSGDIFSVLDGLDFVVDDLATVYDELMPRFPKKWGIFNFYVIRYHQNVYDRVNRMPLSSLDAGGILKLQSWVGHYHDEMRGRLGVTEELLEPHLLDGKQDAMLGEYVNITRAKFSEWRRNLMTTETRAFTTRRDPPEESNGSYNMSAGVIMFQMINQQIDIVVNTDRGRLLLDVVKECGKALDEYQEQWSGLAEKEFSILTTKPEDCTKGLPEYLMALSNDFLKSTEFAETIIKRMDEEASDAYRQKVSDILNQSLEGFIKVSKRVSAMLIDIVILDLKPVLSHLFCPAWYDEPLFNVILGTVEDYCDDFQAHLVEYLFNKLMSDLIERFVLQYLEAMRNRNAKFKSGVVMDKMKSDIDATVELFSRYKSSKRVKASFEPLYKLNSVIGSSARMVFLDLYSLVKAYPDIPLQYVEDVLNKRDDLERSTVKETMADLKEKMEGQKLTEGPPSIFAKLAAS
ncbi:SNARE-binding exocyst subunit S6 [Gonapodya sp. JEL0774]|nr:SNARE-binding exocyst subunit S6 [Gonapodya sp. JEL0774]